MKVLLLPWGVHDASGGTQEDLDAWVAYNRDCVPLPVSFGHDMPLRDRGAFAAAVTALG